METWIFLYFHLDRLGTQRNGTENSIWHESISPSVPFRLISIWFSIHHLNFAISSLAIYSYPVHRSAPWENDWYSTWTFPCSNGAERNGQWWEHHLNFAISSLAIYSYTVPRSAPWYSTWTFPCSNGAERNGFDNDGNTAWTLQSLP